ncbi:MAG: hypothetical protein II920_04580 [Clostridia bacterium]|nr:hypothetical protein [Clostridia bacterium]
MKTKIAVLATLVLAICLLSACRTRVYDNRESGSSGAGDTGTGESGISGQYEDLNFAESEDSEGLKQENPDAERKEYDENAQAEIVSGAEHTLYEPGEGDGQPYADEENTQKANQVNGEAEETALKTDADEDTEQMGVSDDADPASSPLLYYTVLISDRSGSLFECKRANLYWETEEDFVTIHKSMPEHDIILNAGAYDVSSRLLTENLRVDAGWVRRKNPGVIVKIVDKGILGGTVTGTGAAKAVCRSISSREGWSAIDAVKNGKIVLLSREMLEEPYLQTMAMLVIAKTANPEIYEDVDLNHALDMLMNEATGNSAAGIYFYTQAEE